MPSSFENVIAIDQASAPGCFPANAVMLLSASIVNVDMFGFSFTASVLQ